MKELDNITDFVQKAYKEVCWRSNPLTGDSQVAFAPYVTYPFPGGTDALCTYNESPGGTSTCDAKSSDVHRMCACAGSNFHTKIL